MISLMNLKISPVCEGFSFVVPLVRLERTVCGLERCIFDEYRIQWV